MDRAIPHRGRLDRHVALVLDGVLAARTVPEVAAVDDAVREPQRAVVQVIDRLAGHALAHRKVARHRHAARTQHRVEDRLGLEVALVQVLGEQLAIHLDAYDDAVACLRWLKRAAGALHKDPDYEWRKPVKQ